MIKHITGLLACAGLMSLTGCGQQPAEQDNGDIEALQLEIEQLTNAVGRLEFRVCELENYHADPAAGHSDSATQPATAETASPSSDKRYDLTPTE